MAEKKAHPPPDNQRVAFGIAPLDTMLDGGLMPRRPYLVVGPAGTGKTSLALQFLCEGVRRGEPVLYVTLEDPPNEVRRNHRSLRPELDRIDVFDAIPDVMRYERIPFKDISSVRDVVAFGDVPEDIRQTPEFTSTEVTIAALEQFLRMQTQRRHYTRMVIDSLTALQYFCMKGLEPVLGAQTFMRFLSDLKVTTVLTVESPLEGAESPERMLARGEIRLFRWERDGVTVRAVGVEKFRGSAHDSRMHPYRIGPNGIAINLGVTVSRDTRDIAEPAYRVVTTPVEEGAAEEPTPPVSTISGEILDLIAVGVDVSPLRPAVEAALVEVRAGRPDKSEPYVSRISSLSVGLAHSALAAGANGASVPPDSEARRRVAERAERARGGSPPRRLPATDVLRTDLERVLALLPPSPSARASVSPTAPPTAAAPAESVPASAATAGPVAEAPSTPAAPAPHPPVTSAETEAVEEPAPAPPPTVRERPPPTGIAEPPPLPTFAGRPASPSAPGAASPRNGAPSTTTQDPGHRSAKLVAPPLPEPLPLPGEGEIVAPVPPTEAKPAARRRRKTAAKTTTRTTGEAVTADGTLPAVAKPRRRVVRRKKAPPVVSATAEPLPPVADEPPPSTPAEPPPPAPEPP